MKKGIYINSRLVRDALLKQDLKETRVAKRTGIGATAFRCIINDNVLSYGFTITLLQNLADACGLTTAELLAPPTLQVTRTPTPDDSAQESAGPDSARLVSLLYEASHDQTDWRVAIALEWPLSYLHSIAETLDPILAPAGLRLFQYNDRIGLRSLDETMLKTARKLSEHHDPDRGLQLPTAALLHLILRGELGTRNLPRNLGPQLQFLHNLGVIVIHPRTKQRAILTKDAAFSFDVD